MALDQYPVGGLVYSQNNFMGKEQTAKMLSRGSGLYKERIKVALLIGVTEEGSKDYSRLLSLINFDSTDGFRIPRPSESIRFLCNYGEYLKNQGFNLNLAIHTTSGLSGDEIFIAVIKMSFRNSLLHN